MLDYSYTIITTPLTQQAKIRGLYQYPEVDLSKEIQKRRTEGRIFEQSELMLMTHQVLHGLAHLHDNLMSFDDIRPHYIAFEPGTFYSISYLIDRLGSTENTIELNRRYIA